MTRKYGGCFANRAYGLIAVAGTLCIGCTNSQEIPNDEIPNEALSHEIFATDGEVEYSDLPEIQLFESLSKTDVLPHLEDRIESGRNYLFCATAKLAWELVNEARAKPTSKMGQAVSRLQFSTADLESASYFAMVGSNEEILAGMRRKFPDSGVTLPDAVNSGNELAFVYMQKLLPFREKFDRLPKPMSFRSAAGNISVANFGIETFYDVSNRDTVHQTQMSVLDYKSEDDFVIRLNTMSKQDVLVLAKLVPKKTLGETLEIVQARVSNAYSQEDDRSMLQEGEALKVPIISVGLLRQYEELMCTQVVQFRLDESGAKLKSYADSLSLGDDPRPRRFVFDRPFLLYLVQRGSDHPYLVAWVENEELMELAAQ